jgi:hypothetical protein
MYLGCFAVFFAVALAMLHLLEIVSRGTHVDSASLSLLDEDVPNVVLKFV